jgi:ABC-type Fe3+/spermidine/putrescine transport system ATPase subunit
MKIECRDIDFSYDDYKALHGLSLNIESGELIALLGPSGCGKTTLLRIIAGLLPMQSGQLIYDGKDISTSTPQERNTAMVFQSYALFPHLSVGENIAYGLRARKGERKTVDASVKMYLEKVDLLGLENRMVQELSGGQQQRVALARALVLKPDVLLFDEPLSNLDEKLRVKMRREIRLLQKESGITSVYVTHDQEEAMAIADRIVVMNEGHIQQIGSPKEVYHRPNNHFVADFMGVSNIIRIGDDDRLFRPEHIRLSQQGRHSARVSWTEHLGSIEQVAMSYQGNEIIAHRFSYDSSEDQLRVGDQVKFDLLGKGFKIET